MGSSAKRRSRPNPEFLTLFRQEANPDGALTFAHFMALALYHPKVGYYHQARRRIGYGGGTDFFTASTSGPIFGELVAAACLALLGPRDPGAYIFVEIGAEGPDGVLAGVGHPFGEVRTVQLGQPIELAGPSVVFSNELFDAQPFSRFIFRRGAWRELGVTLRDETLVEQELDAPTPGFLPGVSLEGYVIDAPLAATDLAEQIARQPWSGLFVAFDYGKSWRELVQACPPGTGRAYRNHMQSNDLLADPGEQDLTCHICWDWLSDALARHGFAPAVLESQEAFFIRHAAGLIAATLAAEAARFSPRKLALAQLLHPSHLGQKFQVLHAWRD
jgi:SAM-dependent MidA family methyltransferase